MEQPSARRTESFRTGNKSTVALSISPRCTHKSYQRQLSSFRLFLDKQMFQLDLEEVKTSGSYYTASGSFESLPVFPHTLQSRDIPPWDLKAYFSLQVMLISPSMAVFVGIFFPSRDFWKLYSGRNKAVATAVAPTGLPNLEVHIDYAHTQRFLLRTQSKANALTSKIAQLCSSICPGLVGRLMGTVVCHSTRIQLASSHHAVWRYPYPYHQDSQLTCH